MFIFCSRLDGSNGAAFRAAFARWVPQQHGGKLSAMNAPRVLVEGPGVGKSNPVEDCWMWIHMAFHAYRNAMPDNDSALHPLARIKHDFTRGPGAPNLDDQTRQPRQAFQALQLFHHVHR